LTAEAFSGEIRSVQKLHCVPKRFLPFLAAITLALVTLPGVSSAATIQSSHWRLAGAGDLASSHCARPSLKMYGAAPTSIVGPYVLKGGPQVVGGEPGYGGVSVACRWRLSFVVMHHDPTVWLTTGTSILLSPTVIDQFNDGGTDGVNCAGYYQIDNGFGGGAAQEDLASRNCNTDGFVSGEGRVQVVDAALAAGPLTVVAPNQNQWYESFVLGANVLVGKFLFCSEDPIGQHNTYACLQFSAGPYV
jgi:hypothetical protein